MPDAPIVGLLGLCEEQSPYGSPQIRVAAEGAEIFVISDLHIGPGRTTNGCYNGTENFFADASFRRFIDHTLQHLANRSAILIINGDLVDFLRTTGYPMQDTEFSAWQGLVAQVGIVKTIAELRAAISPKEHQFGLQTDDYKSVWKLDQVVQGHPEVFDALAEWIARGHRLIIVKGNHDLEWYWPAVRNYFRLALAQRIASAGKRAGVAQALNDCVAPQLMFIDDTLIVDDVFYIEHGHRYDRYATVVGGPLLPGGTELNLPFGSFFNRYVLNRVELAFPYVDNVRPAGNLLALLIRERFFVGIKLLAYQIPLALRTIPKGYYSYIFRRVLIFALVIGLPLLLAVAFLFAGCPQFRSAFAWLPNLAKLPGGNVLASVLSITASYFLSRIVAYFQLSEPSSLTSNARDVFKAHPEYTFVTMGHTHDPDQFWEGNHQYFNTGTWIPIVELDTAEIRADNTYTFLHFRRDGAGNLRPRWLQRWDDEAGRADNLVIQQSK